MVLSALVLVNIVFVYLLVPISITFRVEKDSDAHRYCDASWQHCSGRQYVAHAVYQSLCADILGIDGLFDGFDDSNHVELPTQPASANGSEAGTVMARECLTSSKIDGPTFDNGHTYIICWYAAGQYSCLQWSDHHLAADLSLFHCQRINRHHRVVDNQEITGTLTTSVRSFWMFMLIRCICLGTGRICTEYSIISRLLLTLIDRFTIGWELLVVMRSVLEMEVRRRTISPGRLLCVARDFKGAVRRFFGGLVEYNT